MLKFFHANLDSRLVKFMIDEFIAIVLLKIHLICMISGLVKFMINEYIAISVLEIHIIFCILRSMRMKTSRRAW